MIIDNVELSEKIFRRIDDKFYVDAYYGLLLYFCIAHTAVYAENEDLLKRCIEYLDDYPDNFEHPHYNYELYRVGGYAKSYLFLKGFKDEWRNELIKYAEITMNAPKNEDGIVGNPINPYRIFIDVAACVVPFMLHVGVGCGIEKYVDFAAKQCFMMYDELMDKEIGLLHQSRGFRPDSSLLSEDHWSRGNGWGLMALTELVKYLPKESKHREKAILYFVNHIDSIIKYQAENGLWRQEIPEKLSWYETSGTGLILYAIGSGIRHGILKDDIYRQVFEKGIEGLARRCITDDFATHLGCSGCLCPGWGKEIHGTVEAYLGEVYPETDEPHSHGPVILALTEAHKLGIKTSELLPQTSKYRRK